MTILALRHAREMSPVHALNPLTKLLVVAIFWLVSLGQFNPLVLIGLILVALTFWRVARIPLRGFAHLLITLSIVFIVLTTINGFML